MRIGTPCRTASRFAQRVPARARTGLYGHASIQVTFDFDGQFFLALDNESAVLAAMQAGIIAGEGGERVAVAPSHQFEEPAIL